MITEDYVNFETAKLLKEKGFDELTPLSYSLPYGYESRITCRNSNDTDFVSRITLQMAMKWLREAHGLDMDISIEYIPKKTYYYSILKKTAIRDIDCLHSKTNFKSYEEACEAGIKYCLENLI